MAGKMFKWRDRRLITKLRNVLNAIDARDFRAVDMTPTQKLSSRNKMFGETVNLVTGHTFATLAANVHGHCLTLLAANEGDPAP